MSSYAYRETFSTRYSDFDFNDALKPSSLLALAQEAACKSADELGFGYESLKPLGYAFIVVSTYCKFRRAIRLGEAVTAETWPLSPRHVIFRRDTRITAGGEEAAAISSRWCLVDFKSFSLLRPEAMGETHFRCPYRDEYAVEVPSWKIPRAEGAREVSRTLVTASRCDHYFHANNTQYADFFFDCFTFEELSRPVGSFQISYVKQAKAGDELVLSRADWQRESICEAHCGDELIAQFRISFQNKEVL